MDITIHLPVRSSITVEQFEVRIDEYIPEASSISVIFWHQNQDIGINQVTSHSIWTPLRLGLMRASAKTLAAYARRG